MVEFDQQRRQVAQAKAQGDAEADDAAGFLAFVGQAGLGRFDQVQDFAAAFEVGRPGRGEGQAARAASDQLDAEMSFQPGDLARDHRARHVQLAGHRGKAAEFSDAQVNAHAVETIHSPSWCCSTSNKQLQIVVYLAANK
jgi:hypothetical protein